MRPALNTMPHPPDSIAPLRHSATPPALPPAAPAPAAVGLSFSGEPADYTTNDTATAADAHAFLRAFFGRFPHLAGNNFFIAGEASTCTCDTARMRLDLWPLADRLLPSCFSATAAGESYAGGPCGAAFFVVACLGTACIQGLPAGLLTCRAAAPTGVYVPMLAREVVRGNAAGTQPAINIKVR